MTRHEAKDGARKVRREPRRRGRRSSNGWRCPRCRSTGDPRACACMRQLRRRLDDARDHLRAGRRGMGETELAQASLLLDLLQKDAVKARGGYTGG